MGRSIKTMDKRVREQFSYWLNDPYFDDKTKQELLAITPWTYTGM